MINTKPTFEVQGQLLREKGINHIISNSQNYLKLYITFSSEWQNLTITAYFCNKDVPSLYSATVSSAGVVQVPAEIFKDFYLHIVGTDGATTSPVLITTNKILVAMEQGGYAAATTATTGTVTTDDEDDEEEIIYDGGEEE